MAGERKGEGGKERDGGREGEGGDSMEVNGRQVCPIAMLQRVQNELHYLLALYTCGTRHRSAKVT